MNTYLVKVEFGKDALYELSKLGKVEYISSVLNLYKVTTNTSVSEVYKINTVEDVIKEGRITIAEIKKEIR